MDREVVENQIFEKVMEIKKLYEKYNRNGKYLSISIVGENVHVNNAYWCEDRDKPIHMMYVDNELTHEDVD